MQKNSSLGKGLAELLGETNFDFINNTNKEESNIDKIEISLIDFSKYQPRKVFNQSTIDELAESISTKGVLQPILIKKNGVRFDLIAGERRLRAAKQCKLTQIPAIILDITENDAMEIALIENIQREQLSPIDEASAITKLINDLNYTHEDLSQKIGKSRSYITNMLRLLNLNPEIQQLLNDNKITMGHARTLINVENADKIAEEIINNNLNVREAEQLVKDQKSAPNDNKVFDKFKYERNQYLSEIKQQIEQSLQLKTKVKHDGKKVKIEISFKTINQLEDFIKIIN
jgi:ParB family chromosome partitioning protein